MFKLSPRAVNQLYSTYSRNCQQTCEPKNYNKMVDQIMELSTSYSMIPAGEPKEAKRKRPNPASLPQEPSNHEQVNIFGRKVVKVNEVSQGPSQLP